MGQGTGGIGEEKRLHVRASFDGRSSSSSGMTGALAALQGGAAQCRHQGTRGDCKAVCEKRCGLPGHYSADDLCDCCCSRVPARRLGELWLLPVILVMEPAPADSASSICRASLCPTSLEQSAWWCWQ